MNIVDMNRQMLARFDGVRFLAGAGTAINLSLLLFLTSDGAFRSLIRAAHNPHAGFPCPA